MFDHPPYLAALILALAGCGAPIGAPDVAGAEPRQAILYRNVVTVEYSDGTLCVAKRPGPATVWSGRLAGCPHTEAYTVTLPPGSLAPRRVLVRLAGGGVRVIDLGDAVYGLPSPAS